MPSCCKRAVLIVKLLVIFSPSVRLWIFWRIDFMLVFVLPIRVLEQAINCYIFSLILLISISRFFYRSIS